MTDVVAQARALADAGQVAEAVALLKAEKRLDVVLELRQAAVDSRPKSSIAEHNLASVLGDMGRGAEAEAAARRAFAKGGDAPETWLILARALVAQNRHEDAGDAYRQAVRRRPGYVDAVRELSQLMWMQTADRAVALQPFEEAEAQGAGSSPLRAAWAQAMEYAGAPPEEILQALRPLAGDPDIAAVCAHAALSVDLDEALTHARTCQRGRPEAGAILKLAEVHLARGETEAALSLIESVLAALPEDQNALSLKAVAWRLLDSPKAHGLYDYDAMVDAYRIDTPDGWISLEAYLADLAPALRRLHALHTHPVGQSLRHGSQTSAPLTLSDDPAIKAFFQAVNRPIRHYIAGLGQGNDPLRRRSTGDYRIAGAWSVELRPGGFHANHVHPEGWLSSACYIDLPAAVSEGRQGWIGFGGPPFLADLPPEYYVKPEPGMLVLFPSYMWHGTQPFTGDQTRLTIAFDVVPA